MGAVRSGLQLFNLLLVFQSYSKTRGFLHGSGFLFLPGYPALKHTFAFDLTETSRSSAVGAGAPVWGLCLGLREGRRWGGAGLALPLEISQMKTAFERASLHPHTFSFDGVPRKGCRVIHRTSGLQALSVSTRDMARKWRLGSGVEATLIRRLIPRVCGLLRVRGTGRQQHRCQGVAVCRGAWLCPGGGTVGRGRGDILGAGLWAGGVVMCLGAWLCAGGGAVP